MMTEVEVVNATIESTLENGCDALFAPLFWYAVFGAPGALFYRLVNTLDAMWGYRTSRYLHFGWAAARFDDFLNYIPARLTALTYSLVGDSRSALACWLSQAALCESPNGGPVMSAGAGALGITLGGSASYQGIKKQKPLLGCGRSAVVTDINRAWALVFRSAVLWVIIISSIIYLCGIYA
jgi:adenosylcobinamide-phosphate synthase